jgi:hypothetical protein
MADDVTINSEKLDELLNDINAHLNNTSKQVLDDLAELALSEMQQNYSKAEYQAGEAMDFSKTGSTSEKTVAMSGPQAAYSEFGTGTQGELHPHPKKNEYGLNPYNSGPTIRPATAKVEEKTGIPTGTLYWTYKDDAGEIHYTQGIPAQKEVYDAGQTVLKEMPSIIKQRLGEIFKQ